MTENVTFRLFQQLIDLIVTSNKEILESFVNGEEEIFFEQQDLIWQEWIQGESDRFQLIENMIIRQQDHMMVLLEMFQKENNLSFQSASPPYKSKRFTDKEWYDNPFFILLKQSYFFLSEQLMSIPDALSLDSVEKKKMDFYIKFIIDAICPTNFLITNPEVVRKAIKTKGQSLVLGMENLAADIEKGYISLTDESSFEVGKNIATSVGAVVFENDIMQLIQYKPVSKMVSEIPLLIIPPCINKYYALDLQPENSFVKYCLEQGNSVFMISWVNPDDQLCGLRWDDYIEKGVLTAIKITNELAGSKQLNAVSWCIGGTFLATSLAVLYDKKTHTGVASATFLTTLLDYSNPGDLSVFIDKTTTEILEASVEKNKFFSGRNLAFIFSILKANELIWSSVIHNYLKGEKPAPFDLLYWNNDVTNLPAPMYNFYLRNMYLENKLVEPDGLTICNVPINLKNIKTPCYFFSTIDDHIAPWESTFLNTELISGPKEFVLGSSGHVAGVINPPIQNKRNYWVKGELGKGASHWLKTATSHPGSWWSHWQKWIKKWSGKKISAPKHLGSKTYPVIENAPGRYVRKRI